MRIVDSHCHLDDVEDVNSYILKARSNGVIALLAIGASQGYESNFKTAEIASSFQNIFFSVGIHPHEFKKQLSLDPLLPLLQNAKAVAVGETGLDKHYYNEIKEQMSLFREHILCARELDKPVIVHCREAYSEIVEVIDSYPDVIFVLHCFTGDSHDVAKLLRYPNVVFSFSGIITFRKAEQLRFAARKIPLDRILVETDAPFLAPNPYRGKQCESWMIVETIKALAEVKNIDAEELADQTTKNFEKVFGVQCGE